MPPFSSILAANNSLATSKAQCDQNNLTAVFAGATSGIGLGTISALLSYTKTPTILIIGRSASTFSPTLTHLRTLNPEARITFLEAQVSLLSEVSRVCEAIKAEHERIDILWLSQGGLGRKHHSLTPEGLNADFAINHYSRFLFISRLLPLLSPSPDPRVISVLSAGQEGAIDFSDLGIRDSAHHSVFPAMKQGVSMMSLSLSHLARQNPGVSFLHTDPGMVSTEVHSKWLNALGEGYGASILRFAASWTIVPLMHSLGWSKEQAGEVGLWMMTDARFEAAGNEGGRNFWRVGEKGDEMRNSEVLEGYEGKGRGEEVWEHTRGVFGEVLRWQND